MTDAPKFMPHPDDPPRTEHTTPAAQGTTSGDSPQFGAPVPARQPYVAPPLAPSSDQNMLGIISLTVSGISGLMIALQFLGGGISLLFPLIGAIIGTVVGVQGLNAVRRGTATNRGVALAGTTVGTVTIIAVPLYFLIVVAAVIAIVGGAG